MQGAFYYRGIGATSTFKTYNTMDEPFTCICQMKTDLENSVDVFSFFKENYPLTRYC